MRRYALAFATIGALTLTGCGVAVQLGGDPKSQLCEEYCDELERLDEIRCTTSDVHTCASILTEKVMLAHSVNEALANEPMSDEVERVHAKVDLVSSPGERFGNNKCFEAGANVGDKLFRCRQIAQDLDERFAELVEQVRKLPA